MLASKSESTWLGEQVRNLRKLRGLSLEALADSIDRSVGFVSQLERGKSEPTITDLINLSVALSVPEHIFFSPSTPADRGVVVRANQRPMLRYAGGITDFLLSPNLAGNFQMQMTLMDPDSESSHELIQSGCIEAAYVLEGEMELWLGEQYFHVKAGDSLAYPSGTYYRYRNSGDSISKVLWIYSHAKL